MLIRDLSLGLCRFDDLRESIGIPNATLAERLKHLVCQGIIERTQYQERPPRYEYRMTAKGRDLWKVNAALREWGDRWNATGFDAPTVEVVDRLTGRKLVLALVDPKTGAAVSRDRVQVRPGQGADAAVRKLLADLDAASGK